MSGSFAAPRLLSFNADTHGSRRGLLTNAAPQLTASSLPPPRKTCPAPRSHRRNFRLRFSPEWAYSTTTQRILGDKACRKQGLENQGLFCTPDAWCINQNAACLVSAANVT